MLGWADEVRRLRVRTNADTPEDARQAREFGAEGIGLCRTEHMFMQQDRLPHVRNMIMAADTAEREQHLAKLLPFQREDFDGIFRAMVGLPVTIRLLDPPLHEFLPNYTEVMVELERLRLTGASADAIAAQEKLAATVKSLAEANPMLGTRGCRLGIQWPEIYAMQVRAIIEAAADVLADTGEKPHVEIMIPLVGFEEELKRMRALTVETADAVLKERGVAIDYTVGTMIEVPRAALTADEIARQADFFSFGTNDLTQMTLGFSRDDAEGKFLTHYLKHRPSQEQPLREARPDRGGPAGRHGRAEGALGQARAQDGHLRRARRRADEREVLPSHRAQLRELQPVPGAAGPAGGRAGGAGREGGEARRATEQARELGALPDGPAGGAGGAARGGQPGAWET